MSIRRNHGCYQRCAPYHLSYLLHWPLAAYSTREDQFWCYKLSNLITYNLSNTLRNAVNKLIHHPGHSYSYIYLDCLCNDRLHERLTCCNASITIYALSLIIAITSLLEHLFLSMTSRTCIYCCLIGQSQ